MGFAEHFEHGEVHRAQVNELIPDRDRTTVIGTD